MKVGAFSVPYAIGLLLASALLPGCGKPPGPMQMVGIWIGEYEDRSLRFEFREDGRCVLSLTDQTTGSVLDLKGRCEMDFTKRPISLTIRGISQLDHPLHTIVAFRDSDTIIMGEFSRRWRLRPIAFQGGANATLVRSRAGS